MKQGWEIKKLGELCKLTRGHNPPKSKFINEPRDGYVRFYQIRDGWADDYIVYVPDSPQLHKVGPEDILMVAYRHIGKVFRGVTGAFNVALCKISINRKDLLDENYLFYIIPTNIIQGELMKRSERSLIPSMSIEHLKEISIPLPSLAEQQRIVAILDEAFDAIARAKANAEQNLKNARELFESYLANIFLHGSWETKNLCDVCDEMFAGGDAPKGNFSTEKNDKYQIPIYANAVKDRGLYGFTDFARVTKPSITIAARGSGTGHTEIRFDQYVPIVRLIVLIPNLTVVNLAFLKHSIDNLTILRSGSAIPQLTIPMMKGYNLPMPSLREQDEIVQKMDALSTETKKLEAIYQQKILALDELKESLLQKAFNGELKTLDPMPA